MWNSIGLLKIVERGASLFQKFENGWNREILKIFI